MTLAEGTKVQVTGADPSLGINGMKGVIRRQLNEAEVLQLFKTNLYVGYRVDLNGDRYDLLAMNLVNLDATKTKECRVVNSVRELVALPEFSFVRGYDGFRHEKQDDGKWLMINGGGRHSEGSIELPATVLYEPEQTKLATIRDRARAAAVVEWQTRVVEGTQGTPKEHAEAIADAVLTVLFPGSGPSDGLTSTEDVR